MAPSVMETDELPETGGGWEARKRWARLDGPGAIIGSWRPFRPSQRWLNGFKGPLKQLRLCQEGARTLKVRYCSCFPFVSKFEVIAIGGRGGFRMCPPLTLYFIYPPVHIWDVWL